MSPRATTARQAGASIDLATLFKALGDATRLEIVVRLADADGELCACELEGVCDLSQPTVSHHLRVLRQAGVVSAERRGTWVYYALRPDVRGRLRTFLERLGRRR